MFDFESVRMATWVSSEPSISCRACSIAKANAKEIESYEQIYKKCRIIKQVKYFI